MSKSSSADTFAARLRAILTHQRVSARELSRRAGIPETTVSRLLNRVGNDPRLSTAAAVARALGVSLDSLAGDG